MRGPSLAHFCALAMLGLLAGALIAPRPAVAHLDAAPSAPSSFVTSDKTWLDTATGDLTHLSYNLSLSAKAVNLDTAYDVVDVLCTDTSMTLHINGTWTAANFPWAYGTKLFGSAEWGCMGEITPGVPTELPFYRNISGFDSFRYDSASGATEINIRTNQASMIHVCTYACARTRAN